MVRAYRKTERKSNQWEGARPKKVRSQAKADARERKDEGDLQSPADVKGLQEVVMTGR
jgi:hypothetical protein